MQFLWPAFLVGLLLVPVLALLYILAQRRRQKYALRYASLSLVREALGRGPGLRRHIPPAFYLLGVASMLLALARPQTVITYPSEEGTVILAMDVSGSMSADDMKPTRMDAAKEAAINFVNRQSDNIRLGVVSFSDNAALVQAPTNDRNAVIAAINRLAPQKGTAIGRGILASLDALTEDTDAQLPVNRLTATALTPTPAVRPLIQPTPARTAVPKGYYAPSLIILLTDGESNIPPAPMDIIGQAVDAGVRVYTVGVGSTQGAVLHIQGESIRSRLDETTLKQIAEATDGQYFNATTDTELKAIYENLKTQFVMRTEKTEITSLFTALAAALSLLGGVLSMLWFNRLP